jgi:predicted transcriptional regulator YheO
MQDLEIQLAALKQLESFLSQFNESMREKSVEFNNRFRSIRESGLATQIADNYEANFADPNLQNLRYLIANITDKDLPYIKENIGIAEQALDRARRG